MHTILLAESALEPMPPELQRERFVEEEARRLRSAPSALLLDSSRHLALMRKRLKDWRRRGRPDIVHFCALLALDSRLNREHGLRLLVHTLNDEVISFASDVRIPQVYNRFCGLMQDLFAKKRIEHSGKVLLELEKKPLKALLAELSASSRVVVLDAGGERKTVLELAGECKKSTCFVIGAFPHESFSSSELKKLPAVSLSDHDLCAWTVLADVITACEIAGSEG